MYISKLVRESLNEEFINVFRSQFGGFFELHKNPGHLNDFEEYVRGVLLPNGDLYMANVSNLMHADIYTALDKLRIDSENSLEIQRKGLTDEICIGETWVINKDFISSASDLEFYKPQVLNIFSKSKRQNPYIEFKYESINSEFMRIAFPEEYELKSERI